MDGVALCLSFRLQDMWESWYFSISNVIVLYEIEFSQKKWSCYDFTTLCFEHVYSVFVEWRLFINVLPVVRNLKKT